MRHPGLSHVYEEILSDQRGSQIYVREQPDLVGASIRQLAYAFPEGVLLGLVRPKGDGFKALLNPPDTLRVEPGDRVVVLATRYSDARPRMGSPPHSSWRNDRRRRHAYRSSAAFWCWAGTIWCRR